MVFFSFSSLSIIRRYFNRITLFPVGYSFLWMDPHGICRIFLSHIYSILLLNHVFPFRSHGIHICAEIFQRILFIAPMITCFEKLMMNLKFYHLW